MKLLLSLLIVLLLSSCTEPTATSSLEIKEITKPSIIVLGTTQDAGSPHIACQKACCKSLFDSGDQSRMVVSLGLVDPIAKATYLMEATPDMPRQLKSLKKKAPWTSETTDGIFLTHAHIGHYTGLMYLGKEAMNADRQPVHVMPAMDTFLRKNGPWSQLVTNDNIALRLLQQNTPVQLTDQLQVTPFIVPHRDEYSETVGYIIKGPKKSALFIPDIDKWEKWSGDIVQEIAKVDYAFVDGTFYDASEINNRDISLIPHPFIIESMEKFKDLPTNEKAKIHFIHFNHTNAALNPDSEQTKEILASGLHIARQGQVFDL